MRKLQPGEREQIRYWEALTSQSLYGKAFVFDVLGEVSLEIPVDMQHFSNRKFKGIVGQLELGQAPRLVEELATLPEWFPDPVPEVVARLPESWCRLVLCGTWKSFVLPQGSLLGGRKDGFLSVNFGWDLLNVQPRQVPQLPRLSGPGLEDLADELDMPMLHNFANSVREVYLECNACSAQRAELEHLVGILEAMAHQCDPFALEASVREMDGHARSQPARKSTPYRVGFLLKAMLLADVLRSSSGMLSAIEASCSIVIPRVLRPLFQDMLQATRSLVPSESTVSKWRVVLDGALMLHARKEIFRILAPMALSDIL